MQKIEKGIAIPQKHLRDTYPWHEMEIGDAVEALGKAASAYNITKASNVRLAPKKFRSGKAADGRMMIWRIA